MEKTRYLKSESPEDFSRRRFIKMSGATLAGTGLLLAGCSSDDDNNDDNNNTPTVSDLPGMRDGSFDFGGGDLGVMTYAYALEQLEADFYTRVVNDDSFTTIFSDDEREVFTDLYNHEVIHREFFRQLLDGMLPDSDTQLLPDLTFNYDSFNFGSRADILTRTILLEDTGVSAYNGSGRLITNPDVLSIAGKIVSVEGRHASVVRNLLSPNSDNFAPSALDAALSPSQVIAAVRSLNVITTPFTATYLP